MDDSFDFGDDDELLAAVEQVEKQVEDKKHQTVNAIDDDFDDFDDEDFILAAETAEQQASTNKGKERQGQLSNFFASSSTARDTSRQINNELVPPTSLEDEPPPTAPSPPPRNTPCSHEFDAEALPTWIYPVNYSIRLYQWNIVKKALFNNTLVALPTGLGKTFIAAVVMYNYWRWFPQSKIVFMAPTRPLVTQQIEACFQICGIDQSDTVELTGQTSKDRRRQLWMSKRVYFLTPQVLQNDLQSRICPAEKVVCLVVDEAHKAQGNYAYTEVIKLIAQRQAQFRVLALTATPGTNIANVQSVVDNLRITAIQIRTEESMDIQEHTHGKNIQTVVVKLDYTAGATGIVPDTVKNFRDKIFVPVLQRLSRFQAIYSTDVERNTPYQLLMAQRQFTANARNFNQAVKSLVHVDFSIAHSVSRAFEMLCQHGVGPFLATIKGTLQEYRDVLDSNKNLPKEKAKLLNSFDLKRIIDNLKQQQQQPGFMGHPKLQRLLHIILEHLTQAESGTSTRIMVFSSFRTSVDEIVKCLSEHEPMVRCSHFVGQAGAKDGKKGLNQREQQDIISRFKRGDLNVIISTSIGEEGLDIGEVDLIICYDSQSSPLRLLQRMGRTGRKRKGRCVMLMTETEERKYRNAKESYNQVQQAIARGGHLRYFKPNPSVIPENYQPVWRKKRFTIGTFIPAASGSGRSKARNRNEKIVNAEGTLLEGPEASFLQKLGAATVEDAFIRYWPKQHALKRTQKYLPSNKVLHYYHHVGHSRRTMQFVELYNKIEPRILYGSDAPQQQEQQ
ncbi:P-loop containing nucleoside triphosphate hydrolase protein, partial [Zychaea mexicana]|uniref:P-loop containing nucleoside triphosphate hydrolase protein n=1 Tax=Zychaea mexicana TaxID=64656 RepID=UPI0022FEC61E